MLCNSTPENLVPTSLSIDPDNFIHPLFCCFGIYVNSSYSCLYVIKILHFTYGQDVILPSMPSLFPLT